MTFGEMRQALWDRLGITAEQTLVQRLLNEAKDRYVTAYKWPHLETSEAVTFTSGTRVIPLNTGIGSIIGLYDFIGTMIDGRVARETYDELYRADTSTATAPTVYCEQGSISTTKAIEVHIWPSPSATTAGTVRGLKRVSDLTTTDTSGTFDFIPTAHHFVLVDMAEQSFHEWEGEESLAQFAMARVEGGLNKLISLFQAPLGEDSTEP